jgi:glutathione peroxidase
MKTKSIIRFFILLIIAIPIILAADTHKNFHDFIVKDIDGKDYSFSQLKGKKVMIVNTASKCGYTPQYQDLEALYQQYKGNNFIIIAFPANNFMNQEPGSNEEIKNFCSSNYEISFPLMSKISVKGEDQHPVYQWLTKKEWNGVQDSEVQWNFQKYLIDEEGKLYMHISHKEKPNSEQIIHWIMETGKK